MLPLGPKETERSRLGFFSFCLPQGPSLAMAGSSAVDRPTEGPGPVAGIRSAEPRPGTGGPTLPSDHVERALQGSLRDGVVPSAQPAASTAVAGGHKLSWPPPQPPPRRDSVDAKAAHARQDRQTQAPMAAEGASQWPADGSHPKVAVETSTARNRPGPSGMTRTPAGRSPRASLPPGATLGESAISPRAGAVWRSNPASVPSLPGFSPGEGDKYPERPSSIASTRSTTTVTAAMAAAGSVWLMSPEASFFRFWDPVILVLLLVTATLTPYEVAFLEDVSEDLDILWWLNRVIDIAFVVDMVLQFFIVKWMSPRQRFTQSLRETSWVYVRGWLLIDFLSVFPWEFVGGMLNDESVQSLSLLRVIRLFRLLKLVRLLRASRILKRWEADMELRYSVMHLCYFLLLCMTVSHWLACLWRLSVDDLTRTDTWIAAVSDTVDIQSPLSVYIASLYFSVYCVTTAGFGDVVPQNDMERLIAVLTMAAGASIYAYSVGSVSAIVASMDEDNNAFHQTMDNLNAWMNDVCLPAEMRAELRKYFHHTRSLSREPTYRRLLSHMSPVLRKRVAAHCHSTWVQQVPFFASKLVPRMERDAFVMEVSLRLVPVSFAPDETVVRHNEPAQLLYILKRGLVIQTLPALVGSCGCNFRVLAPAVVGEDFILTNFARPYSVRSLTFLDGYSLEKRGLEHLLRHDEFPYTKVVLRRQVILCALKARLPALALAYALMTRAKGLPSTDSDGDSLRTITETGKGQALGISPRHSAMAAGSWATQRSPGDRELGCSSRSIGSGNGRTADDSTPRQASAGFSPAGAGSMAPISSRPSMDNLSEFGRRAEADPAGPAVRGATAAARRASGLSLTGLRGPRASLSDHVLAQQVSSQWESAKALLGMGQQLRSTSPDDTTEARRSAIWRPASFSDSPSGSLRALGTPARQTPRALHRSASEINFSRLRTSPLAGRGEVPEHSGREPRQAECQTKAMPDQRTGRTGSVESLEHISEVELERPSPASSALGEP